jgi:hypothetical protein
MLPLLKRSKAFHHCLGISLEGRRIVAESNFDLRVPQPKTTLLIGGMHGDEIATVLLIESFAARFLSPGKLPAPCVAVALANPDSYARRARYNARGVDINRNFGVKWDAQSAEPPGAEPWSEPETRALRDFILVARPAKIVSLHLALAEIDADGPQSTALAHAMWNALNSDEQRPYRVRISESGLGLRRLARTYEFCPGSLGQWCGYGLRYPDGATAAMVTLELPYDPEARTRPSPLPEDHLKVLHDAWHQDPARYLRSTEGAVDKMLLAACAHE